MALPHLLELPKGAVILVVVSLLIASPLPIGSVPIIQDLDRLSNDAIFLGSNKFDPARHERLEIVYHVKDRTRVHIDIYTLSGQTLILRLVNADAEGSISTSVFWDGRSSGGDPVASGIYLIQMRTNRSNIMKMVAVIKK